MVKPENVNISGQTESTELKDDDQPSNTLEFFLELPEIIEMIQNLQKDYEKSFEKCYQQYSSILSKYQEQPHLLDPHLDTLIQELLIYIRNQSNPDQLNNCAFKYMYQLSKVRTFKVFVKYLPHEICDLEFVLVSLEKQSLNDSDNWETRYILLIWMSILVLNPFHMARFDAFVVSPSVSTNNSTAVGVMMNNDFKNHVGELTKMERIFNLCKLNAANNDSCATVAAFLSAKYLIRTDIKDAYLPIFFKWIIEQSNAENEHGDGDVKGIKIGQLAAIAAILKHGKRDDLLQHANTLLKWILNTDYKKSSDFLKNKYFIKIIQRLGLVFLKPRLAHWRYQRGSRSLTANLGVSTAEKIELQNATLEMDADDQIHVPDEIEDVIEELLQALRSPGSSIRWSAAKGIGRVTNRLPKVLGDEVVGSVIEILNPLEPHEAWHGACLAVAELSKRGLLLPYRLGEMVPLLLEALVYDEMKGYMSVGQHIRDASCYMSWAFARAYDPSDLQPFVEKIAAGLIVTAVFDREINCRRAASAAFQESVGRLGNFPHGIDILTEADFYSVGLRTNSFLNISDFVAQYEEYIFPLIDHLIYKKINHWDTVIRELTAKTLYRLTKRAPKYLSDNILPLLFSKTDSIDVNMRHGAVIAIGEITLSLSELELDENSKEIYLNKELIHLSNNLIFKFLQRDQFKGMSGEIMNKCCCDFIRNCSKAKLVVTNECIDSWQSIIDNCLVKKSSQIRDGAILALTELCKSYYTTNTLAEQEPLIVKNLEIIEKYLKGCQNDLEEHVRMGYVSALGVLTKFMLNVNLKNILLMLVKQSLLPHVQLSVLEHYEFHNVDRDTVTGYTVMSGNVENHQTHIWSEARRDSIKALSNIIQTIGFDSGDADGIADQSIISFSNPLYLDLVFKCFLNALQEYTIDDRGDIGAWVREAAMNALYNLLIITPSELLQPNIVHATINGLAQQAVEKIDRTRGLAGKLFCNLIHHTSTIPYIQRHDTLKDIFPQDSSMVLWLFADHTFPMFCSMLKLPEYSQQILIGLIASIGQLTESLIKHSSASMFQFLRSHPQDIQRICEEILLIFQKNLLNERITYPLLNFLDLIISSGTINSVLSDETSNFPEELFRLVKLEIKGHKKLYKIVSSINVFCHLIQVNKLRTRVLSNVTLFLGLRHVHIRKSAATKLYEALILHGDCCNISEENMDEILLILSETDWGLPLNECRPIRNKICTLLDIKPPVTVGPEKME